LYSRTGGKLPLKKGPLPQKKGKRPPPQERGEIPRRRGKKERDPFPHPHRGEWKKGEKSEMLRVGGEKEGYLAGREFFPTGPH